MVGPNKQTSTDTHTSAQCSHASVGLAQARPNKCRLTISLVGLKVRLALPTNFLNTKSPLNHCKSNDQEFQKRTSRYSSFSVIKWWIDSMPLFHCMVAMVAMLSSREAFQWDLYTSTLLPLWWEVGIFHASQLLKVAFLSCTGMALLTSYMI